MQSRQERKDSGWRGSLSVNDNWLVLRMDHSVLSWNMSVSVILDTWKRGSRIVHMWSRSLLPVGSVSRSHAIYCTAQLEVLFWSTKEGGESLTCRRPLERRNAGLNWAVSVCIHVVGDIKLCLKFNRWRCKGHALDKCS